MNALGSPVVVMLALAGASQEQKPAPPTAVVPATVEVVQVDAVVTDSKGNYVTDLEASDFEIDEDGRKQTISNCNYIAPESMTEPPAAMTPLVHLAQRQAVRRTMALVVDDLGLSFESTVRARNALHDFIDRQMLPGDLVAIVRASAGLGALQQFTSDRRMLHAAVDTIRFQLSGRGQIGAFSMPGLHGGGESGGMGNSGQGPAGGAAQMAALKGRMDSFEAARERDRQLYLTSGSLGAVRFVLGGLLRMPGRKSIVLVSEGFPMYDEDGSRSRVSDAVRTLVDLANRASVVIYSFDPSGLKATVSVRVESETRAGMSALANDTGGLLLADSNDLNGQIARVLDDQRGYYLIGYTPDPVSSRTGQAGAAYHRIRVRARRPGLRVRSRRGVYTVAAGEDEVKPGDPAQRLLEAAQSPFSAGDLALRLTTIFEHDKAQGSFVRSLLHLDARGLTFTERPDGSREADLQVVTLAFGADGRAVRSAGRQDHLGIKAEAFEATLRGGLVYSFEMPVARPGGYQVRAAVLDTASGRLGSASQFVAVPKVKKGRLVLSGLAMSGDASDETANPGVAATLRRFRAGAMVTYACFAYNAGSRLEVQPTLYRDTVPVYQPAAEPLEGASQRDPDRLAVIGRLHLPMELEPGAYSLEVVVTESKASGNGRAARQWIEFDIGPLRNP